MRDDNMGGMFKQPKQTKETLRQFEQLNLDYKATINTHAERIEQIRSDQLAQQAQADVVLNDYRVQTEELISKEKNRLEKKAAREVEKAAAIMQIARMGGAKQYFLTQLARPNSAETLSGK